MDRPVLFLARSWHGAGGMQRLNRDVVEHSLRRIGERFHEEHPAGPSWPALVSFCVRSMLAAYRLRGAGPSIHASDVATLPLALVCSLISRGSLGTTACGLDVIWPKQWYQAVIRFCLRRCHRVICISAATAEEVRGRGVDERRITIIPCGIDSSSCPLNVQRDPHLMVTVGRLVSRKGVAWFIEHVFPSLLRGDPELRYVVIGRGPEEVHIRHLIHRLELDGSVSLWTDVSDEVRASFLDAATVCVVPNIPVSGDMEGFGIVCIEAGERGLQTAAAELEGLTDAVINGATGRLFKAGDAASCIQILRRMLKDPINPVAVRSSTIDRFSWDNVIPLYLDAFNH